MMRVLFVDDEQLILNALRRTLRNEGFALFFTTDPLSVPRMIAEERIDVIVSDHMMPDMSGVELLALVRSLHRNVVRVMMTGQADLSATIRAVNEGAVHRFLEKPWDDANLKRVLHEIERSRDRLAVAAPAPALPPLAPRAPLPARAPRQRAASLDS